ncbi:MAG: DUF2992 family protein [Spirochaetales bacterium]|nr:DUF2992 family protein [Spirochaetales bacterium]
MKQTVSTILFNGQFWIALVERYEDDGSISVGKYTFGPEPTNTDLLNFYLHVVCHIRLHKTESKVRLKKRYTQKETERKTRKSFEEFSIQQKEFLKNKKSIKAKETRQKDLDNYNKKRLKKKEKRKGH